MPDEQRVVPLYQEEDSEPLPSAEHAELLKTILDWHQAADTFREPHKREWRRAYLMYRGFVTPRKAGEWQHRVFIPISFHVIETEMPKLIAQLPQPIVLPVGPEDVEPARRMEERLKWAFDQSGLWLELVYGYRSACKYGTAVLKVYPGRKEGWEVQKVPKMRTETRMMSEPVVGPDGPMLDLDGQPLVDSQTYDEQVPVIGDDGQPEFETIRRAFAYYEGPIAKFLDVEDIWVAPEATSVEDSRFLIERVWKDLSAVKDLFDDGTYQMPEGSGMMDLFSLEEREQNPALERQGELGLSSQPDVTRQPVEVWEVWTRAGDLITVLNQRLVVRVVKNPFAHGQKPYIRILDHVQENEFYGVGELGPIAGIQDAINALWNSRLDNVRLVLQRVFAVNPDNLYDLRDLRLSPGKAIRIRSTAGINPADLLMPIDFPDVTASAFEEVNELIGLVERVLSISGVTGDEANSAWNQTATGVSITSEVGNNRFALKVRMAELTGLVPLARQFATLLQQYTPPEMWIRIEGTEGAPEFPVDPQTGQPVPVTAQDIQGQFDFDIEAGSMNQTDSFRKELEMTLFNLLAGRADAMGIPLMQDREMAKDLLRTWGKKDFERLIVDPQTFMLEQQQQAMAQMGGLPQGLGMPAPPEEQMAGATY